MYAGQIIEVAPAAEFFAAPKHPYAGALLRALPRGERRAEPLEAIAGTVPPLTQHFAGCRFAPRCAQAMPQCACTVPELQQLAAGHQVRCLLYGGAAVEGAHPRPFPQAGEGRERSGGFEPLAASPLSGPGLQAAARTASEGAAPPQKAPPLLDVQHLSVRFPIRRGLLQRVHGHFSAVDDVSFQVGRGQTLALVGESGCGKTTTGKAIVQLLRRVAHIEGRALLDGRDLFALQGPGLQLARRQVQIIFQDPFASLNPRMRVFDILEEGLQALLPELDATQRRARIERLTDQVGLRRDALGRWPHEFSGGQRQRIAIARALAVEPRLIVCDEPTSALDVSVQAQILNLLRQLQRELGVSYLFITHNIGVVEYVADRLAVMRAGRIEEQGACAEVLERPRSEYTRSLLAAVPRLAVAAA
jgi:peptide/nickel transport system ATP-binding protein